MLIIWVAGTIDPVETKLIHQCPGASDKVVQAGTALGYQRKVLTPLAPTADGEDDFHLGVLRF